MPNHCPVCRMAIRDALAVCQACETPHHPECWEFGRGCAVFACGSERARVLDAASFRPAVEEIVLDGTEADPPWYRSRQEAGAPDRPVLVPLTVSRESAPVVLVSWLYLAVSLVCAIPAAGYALLTLSGELEMAGAAIACAALAAAIKEIGDLIAIGSPRGRLVHFGVCAMLAAAAGSAGFTCFLLVLCAPFWSQRGRVHFGAPSPG